MAQSRKERQVELITKYRIAEKEGNRKACRDIENIVLKENLKLAEQLAGRVMSRLSVPFYGEHSDILQGALIGLLKAWKGWDPEKGMYSTYCGWWVRKAVQDVVSDYLPIFKIKHVAKPWQVHRIQEAFQAQYNRAPTADEVNERIAYKGWKLEVTEEELENWRATPSAVPYEEVVGDDYGDNYVRSIPTPLYRAAAPTRNLEDDRSNPEMSANKAETFQRLMDTILELEPREQDIIERTVMGTDTVEDLALEWELTDAYVRRLRSDTIQKLRKMMYVQEADGDS